MSQILADAEMEKAIEEAEGPLSIVNSKGTVIASVTPVKFPHSPYTREEVEAARKQCRETGGKSLVDIMAKLREQHP